MSRSMAMGPTLWSVPKSVFWGWAGLGVWKGLMCGWVPVWGIVRESGRVGSWCAALHLPWLQAAKPELVGQRMSTAG